MNPLISQPGNATRQDCRDNRDLLMDPDRLREIVAFLDAMATKLQHVPRALYVDDSPDDTFLAMHVLGKFVVEAVACANTTTAVPLIRDGKFDVVFIDAVFPGEIDGIELIATTATIAASTRFVVVTGHPDSAVISNALRKGALMAFEKPLNEEICSLFFKRKNQ